MKKQKGFTLVEMLVGFAIIGLLASVIVIGIGSKRAKARDGKRLFDLTQIRTGLEIYYSEGEGYPDDAVWNNAQVKRIQLTCNNNRGFIIADDPLGVPYLYTADGANNAGCGGTVWSSYEIEFTTEEQTYLGPAGTYYLTPYGFSKATQLTAAGKAKKCPPKSKAKSCVNK